MQLVFAANIFAGIIPGDFVSSKSSEESAERFNMVERSNCEP